MYQPWSSKACVSSCPMTTPIPPKLRALDNKRDICDICVYLQQVTLTDCRLFILHGLNLLWQFSGGLLSFGFSSSKKVHCMRPTWARTDCRTEPGGFLQAEPSRSWSGCNMHSQWAGSCSTCRHRKSHNMRRTTRSLQIKSIDCAWCSVPGWQQISLEGMEGWGPDLPTPSPAA